MMNLSDHRGPRLSFLLAAGLALAGVLLAARPAPAQYVVSPDRSTVILGPRQPYQFRASFTVTPVVIPGSSRVRVTGSYSFIVVDPTRNSYPGPAFIQPFYVNDRAKGANFYGSPNYNPLPVVTGPFQVWW